MKDKKLFLILGGLAVVLIFALVILPKITGGETDEPQDTGPKDMVFAKIEDYDVAMESKKILRPMRNEDWIYNVYEDHIEIAQYIGNAKSITVPNELPSGTDTSLPVYSILGESFLGSNAENVVISPGIVDICPSAFSASSVVNVSVPDTVLRVSDSAFASCENLRRVKLGKNVSSLGLKAFSNCINLQSINAPENIKSYGDLCFSNCESLVYLEIGGVEIIPQSMCLNCYNLSVVKIKEQPMPTDLDEETASTWEANRTISDSAFSGCDMLSSLYIPSDIKNISSSMISISENNGNEIRKRLTISGFISSSAALYAAQNKLLFNPVDLEEFEANGNVVIRLKTGIEKIISKYEKTNSHGELYIPNSYSQSFFNEVIKFSDELVGKELIGTYTVTNDNYTATLKNGQNFTLTLNVSNVVEEEEEETTKPPETSSTAQEGEK